jgi:hypothetical protein
MTDAPALRLAITGATRTGKSTVTTALSLATGLPRIHVALEAIAASDERRLGETVETPVRAFEFRVDSEARATGGFISDGSVLHEWAEAEATRRERPRGSWIRYPREISFRMFEKRFLAAHAGIVTRHANATYDAVVHLRISADDVTDEGAVRRRLADRILVDTLYTSTIPYLVVGGPPEEVLAHVTNLFRLPRLMPIADAVSAASEAA